MTMQSAPHPDDELLAAYAGGDRDALADASLIAHLASCDRCGPLVDELSILRGALAELPDLAPSRPLRLIPPIAEPAMPAARGSWLRRLTAPAMAAGAALIVVGAVGFGASGGAIGLFGKSASLESAHSPSASGAGAFPVAGGASSSLTPKDNAGGSPAAFDSNVPRSLASAAPQPTTPRLSATDSTRRNTYEGTGSPGGPEQPWLTLLIAGAALFVISTALRFSLSPRAG
jgi:hypothetical protein